MRQQARVVAALWVVVAAGLAAFAGHAPDALRRARTGRDPARESPYKTRS
jgi:hypothetical protein